MGRKVEESKGRRVGRCDKKKRVLVLRAAFFDEFPVGIWRNSPTARRASGGRSHGAGWVCGGRIFDGQSGTDVGIERRRGRTAGMGGRRLNRGDAETQRGEVSLAKARGE